MNSPMTLYAPIVKAETQDDGSLLAHVRITSEAVDSDGEILDYEASKAAVGDWMEWANVREMHQPSAVGVALSTTSDDAARAIDGTVRIVDPTAVAKTLAGVYKGVSVGGRRLSVASEKVADATVRRVTKWAMTELSLVDRPANPDSRLVLAKRAADEEGEMPEDETTTTAEPTEAEVVIDDADAETAAKVDDPDDLAKKDKDPNVGGGVDRDKLPAADFAGPDRSFPIVKPGDVADAASSLGRAKGDREAIKAAIIRIAHRKGEAFVAQLPKAWTEEADKAAQPDDLVKSETGDVLTAAYLLSQLELLIAQEAGEPEDEADQVALLRHAQSDIAAFVGKEAAEIGSEPDAEEEAEVGSEASIAMAAEPVDIAKIVADAVAAEMTKRAPAPAEPDVEALITKTISAFGPVSRPADVEAMEARIAKRLDASEALLAKIAAQPAPGGAFRYAPPRGTETADDDDVTPLLKSKVLAEEALLVSDPGMRQELQVRAAAARFSADRTR